MSDPISPSAKAFFAELGAAWAHALRVHEDTGDPTLRLGLSSALLVAATDSGALLVERRKANRSLTDSEATALLDVSQLLWNAVGMYPRPYEGCGTLVDDVTVYRATLDAFLDRLRIGPFGVVMAAARA